MATAILLLAVGCTRPTLVKPGRDIPGIEDHESVVVLGHTYTKATMTLKLILSSVSVLVHWKGSRVWMVPEQEFTDRLYPGLNRTALVRIDGLHNLVFSKRTFSNIFDMGIRYIIWVDGSTETTGSAGSIACSIGPGGAGCLGFGTWDNESLCGSSNLGFLEYMTTVGQN